MSQKECSVSLWVRSTVLWNTLKCLHVNASIGFSSNYVIKHWQTDRIVILAQQFLNINTLPFESISNLPRSDFPLLNTSLNADERLWGKRSIVLLIYFIMFLIFLFAKADFLKGIVFNVEIYSICEFVELSFVQAAAKLAVYKCLNRLSSEISRSSSVDLCSTCPLSNLE